MSSSSCSTESDGVEEAERIAVNQLLYDYVRLGAKEKVDSLLEKCYADINCVHYGENLLMTAIRTDNEDMAQFLIENGINVNFRRNLVDFVKVRKSYRLDCYRIDCRQAAYNKGQLAIVHLIDFINGNLFPFQREPPYFPQVRIFRAQTPDTLISLTEDFFEGFRSEDVIYDKKARQRQQKISVNSAPHEGDFEVEEREKSKFLSANNGYRLCKLSLNSMGSRGVRQNKSFILRQHHNMQRCSSAPVNRTCQNQSNIVPPLVFRKKFEKDPFPH